MSQLWYIFGVFTDILVVKKQVHVYQQERDALSSNLEAVKLHVRVNLVSNSLLAHAMKRMMDQTNYSTSKHRNNRKLTLQPASEK